VAKKDQPTTERAPRRVTGRREAAPPPRARRAPEPAGSTDLRFSRRNYIALGAALAAIVLGFFLLSLGSVTLAPILLVLGYCVLVPYGLAAGQGAPAATHSPAGE
jgi:hypothetical protein